MFNSDKINRWRTAILVWVGLPALAVVGLRFGATDLLPAWEARAGKGTPGTFTATREECSSRRTCNWHGDFTADDGDGARTDVVLYDEPDGLQVGDSVPARDTGARKGVFSVAGGSTWLLVTGFVVAGLIAAVAWVVMLVRWLGRRRAKRPAFTG